MALLLLLLLSLFMKIVKAVVGNGLVISPHDGCRIWWTSITRVKLTYSVHAVWPDIPGSMTQKKLQNWAKIGLFCAEWDVKNLIINCCIKSRVSPAKYGQFLQKYRNFLVSLNQNSNNQFEHWLFSPKSKHKIT